MSALLVRADASTEIGTGHVMRCLALAQAWREAGGVATFLTSHAVPSIEERLRVEGISICHLQAEPGSAEDAEETVDWAMQLGAKWIVADGYHFRTEFQRALNAERVRKLFIADGGAKDLSSMDALLNQNLFASEKMYGGRKGRTRLLLGTRYALIRKEFWKWRGRSRVVPDIAANILVTMGGSDPDNATGRVLQVLLKDDPELVVKVVIGAANPHVESLRSIAGSAHGRYQLIVDTREMPELMAWADCAIAAGGSTCWELALMGLPMVLVVLAENQRLIAAGLEDEGAAINLGWADSFGEADAGTAIESLLSDWRRRSTMSAAGRRLVDGYGAERVVRALHDPE